jgi:hypothetical protein
MSASHLSYPDRRLINALATNISTTTLVVTQGRDQRRGSVLDGDAHKSSHDRQDMGSLALHS